MNVNSVFNNVFSNDLGIDLGTDRTRIYAAGSGIVLDEPSAVAVNVHTGEVVAAGSKAREMLGKTPEALTVVCPVENGVISDFNLAAEMLKSFLSGVFKRNLLKPRIMMNIGAGATGVERRAVIDAARLAGARRVYAMESTLAAASGAGCDISLARGMLIADIGAGQTNIASISLGHAVISRSVRTAGNSFTAAIVRLLRDKYKLEIGINTAEAVKREIGCVYPYPEIRRTEVFGSDMSSGMPASVTVSSEEIREACDTCIDELVSGIRHALEDTPPELASDILEDGILISGGGAKIYGLDKRLRLEMSIKVFLAEDMDLCVIKGIGEALGKIDTETDAAHTYYTEN